MPKARKRKKDIGRKSTAGTSAAPAKTVRSVAGPEPRLRNRAFLSPGVSGPQSLLMPGLVALGCWGLAFSFLVFSNDPNHLLFSGMAVLMALLWSFSVFIRLRKLLLLRQKA